MSFDFRWHFVKMILWSLYKAGSISLQKSQTDWLKGEMLQIIMENIQPVRERRDLGGSKPEKLRGPPFNDNASRCVRVKSCQRDSWGSHWNNDSSKWIARNSTFQTAWNATSKFLIKTPLKPANERCEVFCDAFTKGSEILKSPVSKLIYILFALKFGQG